MYKIQKKKTCQNETVDKKMPCFQNNAHVQNVSNQKRIWTAFALIVFRPSAPVYSLMILLTDVYHYTLYVSLSPCMIWCSDDSSMDDSLTFTVE